MSNSRRALFTRLCLIVLLLWGQSAVAQHELDHFWHDATELCQVFSSADNAKAALTSVAVLISSSTVEVLTPLGAPSVLAQRVAKQTARGPPIHHTLPLS